MFSIVSFYMLGSLLLGLTAWTLPLICLFRRRHPGPFCAASFLLCSISLPFQIFYTQHLLNIWDWSALEDTHYAVCFASVVMLSVTAALYLIAFAAAKRRR